MLKELKVGFLMMAVMTVLTGLVYPALITIIAQVIFPDQANGSLIVSNGQVIGSRLLGQGFTKPEYFHPRPSAAGSGYDPTASAGSNLGPTSAKLLNGIVNTDDKGVESVGYDGFKVRVVHYAVDNGIPFDSSVPLDTFKDADGNLDDVKLIKAFTDEKTPLTFTPKTPIPADAIAASASGLDPHISPANAALQVSRVAQARNVSVDQVQALVAQHTEGRTLGILGEPHVNVLELNLALDGQFPAPPAAAPAATQEPAPASEPALEPAPSGPSTP
jgi:K+-transporting ATPase ATPase C chain